MIARCAEYNAEALEHLRGRRYSLGRGLSGRLEMASNPYIGGAEGGVNIVVMTP